MEENNLTIKTEKDTFALVSFIFGITTIMGIWGFETSIGWLSIISPPLGLIFGILGLKSQRRTLAIIGIVINLLAWPLSLIFL
jgi:hypothetical protein